MRKLLNKELHRLSADAFRQAEKLPLILVLDNVRSLHNVGSVFRTADAFRVEAIFLCGITGSPPHREIHKTALGATESVSWKYFSTTEEAVLQLKQQQCKVFAVEQAEGSIPLQHFEQPENVALVFGNEVEGVRQQVMHMVDGSIEIPQGGTKHSLNISVSVGITVWEFWRKQQKRK